MEDLREILAANLAKAMDLSPDLKSQSALAKRSKVAQTTIGNYVSKKYAGSPSLVKVQRLARAFGLETWQLLHPTMGDKTITAAELELYKRLRDTIKAAEAD